MLDRVDLALVLNIIRMTSHIAQQFLRSPSVPEFMVTRGPRWSNRLIPFASHPVFSLVMLSNISPISPLLISPMSLYVRVALL
jgi:hypothetical protein